MTRKVLEMVAWFLVGVVGTMALIIGMIATALLLL